MAVVGEELFSLELAVVVVVVVVSSCAKVGGCRSTVHSCVDGRSVPFATCALLKLHCSLRCRSPDEIFLIKATVGREG